MNNLYIEITDAMKKSAAEESRTRDKDILHHFEIKHASRKKRDVIGFLGEFACTHIKT